MDELRSEPVTPEIAAKENDPLSTLRVPGYTRRDMLAAVTAPLISLGLANVSFGQEPAAVKPNSPPSTERLDFPQGPARPQRLLPSRQEIASIGISVPNHREIDPRRVIIVRGEYEPLRGTPDGKSGAVCGKVPYFHTPLPLLIAKNDGDIVWERVKTERKGQTHIVLTYQTALSAPRFRGKGQELICREDASYLRTLDAKPDDVALNRYPVGACLITVQPRIAPREVIAFDFVDGLDFVEDQFSFQLAIPDADYKSYCELEKLGLIEFTLNYTYAGRGSAQVIQSVELDKSAQEKIEQMLKSAQDTRRGPIFQNERNQLANEMTLIVKQHTLIRGSEAIPLARISVDQMLTQVMQEATIHGAQAKALCEQSEVKARLTGYLQALRQELGESNEGFQIHEATDAKEIVEAERTGRTWGVSGEVGVNIYFVSAKLGGSAQFTKENEKIERILKAIQDKTGVSYQKSKSSPFYEPHDIKYSMWLGVQQKISLAHSSITTLVLGESEDRLPPLTIVPALNSKNVPQFGIGNRGLGF